MRVGYARVRPDPRDAHGQREALNNYEVEDFFVDVGRASLGTDSDGLTAAVAAAGNGGELAITTLSRLARSLAELGLVLGMLADQNIALRVGPSVFDLRSADQLLATVIGVAADFNADLAAQRATVGWRTARRVSKSAGTRPPLTAAQKADIAAQARAGVTAEQLAAMFGVGRSRIYQVLAGMTGPRHPSSS